MYCIVDWHSIGNVETGEAPLMKDLYCHTKDMTLDFWRRTAARLKDRPNVVFEIFIEPHGIAAPDWRRGILRQAPVGLPGFPGHGMDRVLVR